MQIIRNTTVLKKITIDGKNIMFRDRIGMDTQKFKFSNLNESSQVFLKLKLVFYFNGNINYFLVQHILNNLSSRKYLREVRELINAE